MKNASAKMIAYTKNLLLIVVIVNLINSQTVDYVKEVEKDLQKFFCPDEITNLFANEKNPNKRSELVKRLDFVAERFSAANLRKNPPAWATELLGQALNDKHVYVCETALRQIGKIRAVQFEQDIIDLYPKLYQRFGDNPIPMRLLIIDVLGQLRGDASVKFLIGIVDQKILNEENEAAIRTMGKWGDTRFQAALIRHQQFWGKKLQEEYESETAENLKNKNAKGNAVNTVLAEKKMKEEENHRNHYKMIVQSSIDLAKNSLNAITEGVRYE